MAIPLGRYRRLWLILAALLAILAVVELTGLREQFSLSSLRAHLEANPISGLLIFVTAFVVGNLISLPGWPFLAAAILALGTVMGGLVTYLAANVSCLVTFLLVNRVGGDALRDLDSQFAKRMLEKLDQYPLRVVWVLRVVFQTLPGLNYALALSGVRLRHYMLGTLMGLPFPMLVYCFFFDRIALVLGI